MLKQVHIIGGGTVAHIRPHLAVCAPAYGKTVEDLYRIFVDAHTITGHGYLVHTWTTKMAGNQHRLWSARSGYDYVMPSNLETNEGTREVLL